MKKTNALRAVLAAALLAGCPEERIEGTVAGDCSDAADNDADGLFDCDDPGCQGSPVCEPSPADAGPVDTGRPDAGSPTDAATADSGWPDAGPTDSGSPDTGVDASPGVNYALSFDGDGDDVEFPMSIGDLGSRFTFEAWVRPTATNHAYDVGGVIFVHRADCRDFLLQWSARDDNRFSWLIYPDSGCGGQVHIYSENSSTLNEWHHVAGVFQDGQMRLYVDGSLEASGVITEPISWDASLLGHWTGRDGYDSRPDRGALFGDIDEIRISDVARYDGSSIAPPRHFTLDPDTTALWRFDEGAGTEARDLSANALHGQIHNAAWIVSDR